jgi:hypothetical protein
VLTLIFFFFHHSFLFFGCEASLSNNNKTTQKEYKKNKYKRGGMMVNIYVGLKGALRVGNFSRGLHLKLLFDYKPRIAEKLAENLIFPTNIFIFYFSFPL